MACIRACVQCMRGCYRMHRIKSAMDRLARAKVNAERARQGLPPIGTWYENLIDNCCGWLQETCLRAFCPCCLNDPDDHQVAPCRCYRATCCGRMWLHGTKENKIFKHFLGFLSGLGITFLWFLVMVYQLQYAVRTSMITCVVMGAVLSLGMAFSESIRCVTLLSLPQIFSSKGRAVLIGIAMVMVLNGPMNNFRHNVHVMAESQTCAQQMTYNVTKELVESAASPIIGVLNEIRQVLIGLMDLANKLQEVVLGVRDLFAEILDAIQRAFDWLDDMVDMCNDSMGAPYNKCKGAFDKAVVSCKKELPGILEGLCKIPKAFDGLCKVAKIGELLCLISAKIKEFVVSKIMPQMSFALSNVYDMFYFNVTLDYYYDVTMEQSKTFEDVRKDIEEEIEERMQPLMFVTRWSNVFMVVMLFWLFIRALIYRHKFLTSDRFDNSYITNAVKLINEKREDESKETVLPLERREASKYVSSMSVRLVKGEKRKLIGGLTLLLISGFHAGFYLTCDYSLYWVLDLVRIHGQLKINNQAPSHLRMHVEGEGVLADVYRALITQFDPVDKSDAVIDTTPCLPNPSHPDLNKYQTIGIIFATSIFLVLTEAYGLRLRHVIMGCYHTQRARERAVWLYNNILRRRGGFLKFMRRKLRQRYRNEEEEDKLHKVSVLNRIAAQCPLVGKLLRLLGLKDKFCLACGIAGQPGDMNNFIHCANYGCKGVYCHDCFTDINNLCTVCMNPVEYGDFSDFSEERDSSDDDGEAARGKDAAVKMAIIGVEEEHRSATEDEPDSHPYLSEADSHVYLSEADSHPYLSEADSMSEVNTSLADSDPDYPSGRETQAFPMHTIKTRKSSKRDLVSMEIFSSEDSRHMDSEFSSDEEYSHKPRGFRKSHTDSKIYLRTKHHPESDTELDLYSDYHYDSWHGNRTGSLDYVISDQSHIPQSGL